MKNKFSKEWKASKKPAKQRKYSANLPRHAKNSMLGAHLSKALREKHAARTFTVRKGDKVKIMRGQFKGKSGKVERVEPKSLHVFVAGVEFLKKDGSKALYPIMPSKLMIEELNMDDKRRVKRAGGKSR